MHPIFNEIITIKNLLSGSIVIGLLQVIDGVFQLNGIQSDFSIAFSILELLWFLIILIVLYINRADKWMSLFKISALSFIFYYVTGVLYGSYLLVQMQNNESFLLPTSYILFTAIFGLYYVVLNFRIYRFKIS